MIKRTNGRQQRILNKNRELQDKIQIIKIKKSNMIDEGQLLEKMLPG